MRLAIQLATALVLATPALAQPKAAKPARAEPGQVLKPSAYGVKETVDRLAKEVEARGAKVVARVDHAAGAKAVGSDMKPSEVLIFGNPRLGTPLMAAGNVRAGLDLPLRVLAYEDAAGKAWVVYTAPATLQSRWRIKDNVAREAVKTMTKVLDDVTAAAVK